MKRVLAFFIGLVLGGCAAGSPSQTGDVVKITGLGSHDGELCPFDRALIFEDPDGTRILYDIGRTVRGGSDPRLGKIDAVLLTHVHGDHIGDSHQPSANAGSCSKPDMSVNDAPNSNTVNVVIAKQAPLIVGGEMHFFFTAKIKSLGGDPAKLVRLVRFGATTPVGKVVVAGDFSAPMSVVGAYVHCEGESDAFVAKLDTQGFPVWLRGAGNSHKQRATSLSIAPSDAVVLTVASAGGPLDLGAGPQWGDSYVIVLAP